MDATDKESNPPPSTTFSSKGSDGNQGDVSPALKDCTYCACFEEAYKPHTEEHGGSLLGQRNNFKVTPEDRHYLFHQDCPSCPSTDKPAAELCQFCQHLRLRHILSCSYLRDAWLSFDMGTFSDVEGRRHCCFCRLVTSTSRNILEVRFPDRDEEFCKMNIYLEKPSQTDGTSSWLEVVMYTSTYRLFMRSRLSIIDLLEHSRTGTAPEIFRNETFRDTVSPVSSKPLTNRFVVWEQVQHWLQKCSERHPQCRSASSKLNSFSDFRLIDVRKRKVLKSSSDCRFVALSYVWGARPWSEVRRHALCKTRVTELEQEGSLKGLPRTIEDAISICKHLEEEYLWVDLLCIVQDDQENKQRQINSMAWIFSSAVLTIINACGDTMGCPVAGVSQRRQLLQQRTSFSNLQVTSILPNFKELISKTIWHTRGWTYQEAVFSKRKLFFTAVEAWFECEEGLDREDLHYIIPLSWLKESPYALSSFTSPRNKVHPSGQCILKDFDSHLRAYSARTLTHQSDIYNAFWGIASALYEDGPFSYGLPHADFDQAILWSHVRGFRYDKIHHLRDSDVVLPSWTWASVTGRTSIFPYPWDEYRFIRTLVEWTECLPDIQDQGENQAVRKIETSNEPIRWQIWRDKKDGPCPQLFLAIAWSEGCFEADAPSDFLEQLNLPFLHLSRAFTSRWPTEKDFRAELLSVQRTGEQLDRKPFACANIPAHHIRKGALITRAQTASFRLRVHQPHELCQMGHYPVYEILDAVNQPIGLLQAGEPRVATEVKPYLDSEHAGFELVALSLSIVAHEIRCLAPLALHLSTSELCAQREFGYTCFDVEGTPLSPAPVVNVFLLGWQDGVAHRVSVGWVFLTKWARAERAFKDIVLE